MVRLRKNVKKKHHIYTLRIQIEIESVKISKVRLHSNAVKWFACVSIEMMFACIWSEKTEASDVSRWIIFIYCCAFESKLIGHDFHLLKRYLFNFSAILIISCGPVRQHPPINLAPSANHSSIWSTKVCLSDRVTHVFVIGSYCSPEFG